jgi:hypothetical protein
MAGTKMIPAVSYLLSLLTLKLVDKERKSHITDFSFDEGLGLFPGLNILPKATAITDYSYRLVEQQHTLLLKEWVHAICPLLCPEGASTFALDFHAIPYRGEQKTLENHYVPSKGKAQPAILTCFARSIDPPMLCYADADITNADKPDMILQFINYWKQITGIVPDWLYFDSKMTPYSTPGQIYFPPGEIVVKLDRRAHNPIIAQAKLDDQNIRIPWLDNRKLSIEFC